jgi:hypothetical protein
MRIKNMAVQITGRQIANSAVDVNKLNLSSGTFNFQSAVLQVATPSADSHAASKGYVDSVSQGLHWKESVKVATTANITLSGTQTIDGIAISADQRVLVKNQSTGSQNGIYLCKAGAWERAADMNAAGEFSGSAVFVQQGTVNGDTGYVCTNDGDVTVGTTAITFVQFTGAGQLTGGNGIDISGSTISIDLDGSSLSAGASGVKIADGGVTNAMLAGSIANAKLLNSSVSLGGVSVALGASDATPAFNLSDATNYPTSSLVGTITNAQLAGSIGADKLSLGNGLENNSGSLIIALDGGTLALGAGGLSVEDGGIGASQLAADCVVSAKIADGAIDSAAYIADSLITNAKLANSSVSFGGVTLALGASDATPAFDLTDATNYPTSSLSGTITNAQLAGSIANAKLANSSVSFGGVTLALGASDATPAFDLADATNLPTSSLTGTISTAQLAADCVTNAKIADDAVKTENLDFAGFFQSFDANGSTAAFEMAGVVDLEFKQFFVVTVNGLVMEYKDTPDAQDNYKIDNGGTGGVGRIVFGANLANDDRVTIRGFINN